MQDKKWSARLYTMTAAPARKADILFWIIAGFAILTISIIYNRFGLLHFELRNYIPYHLAPGPIWKKIFDFRTLDNGTYEGREFSYLIDHIDVLILAQSVKWGLPLFISFTHVILCVFTGVWLGWFAAKDLKLGSLNGLLLALLFWTAPFVYLHYLLRTAKILTAAALVVLIIEIYRALIKSTASIATQRLPFRYFISLAISAWVLCFSDRQGFFFLVIICLFLALQWGIKRNWRTGRILQLLISILIFELIYFFWIAPALTEYLFNYPRDLSFNQIPLGELFTSPLHLADQALSLLVGTCSLLLGNTSHWSLAPALILALIFALAQDIKQRIWRDRIPLTAFIVITLFALWGMFILMVVRHPPILWPDIRLIYYWIPTGALIALGTAYIMAEWTDGYAPRKIAFSALLLLMIIGNISALPKHRQLVENGHLHDYIIITQAIRDGLMHPQDLAYVPLLDVKSAEIYRTLLNYSLDFGQSGIRPDLLTIASMNRPSPIGSTRSTISQSPTEYIKRMRGNVDPRYVSTSADFYEAADSRRFLGGSKGSLEMRVNLTTNRLSGELILYRLEVDDTKSLTADFTIYSQTSKSSRLVRQTTRAELRPGEKFLAVPYAIDSRHSPTIFTVEIPTVSAGRLTAGWSNPTITDAGGDSDEPKWFDQSTSPAVIINEITLAKLLPKGWRPIQAQMRNGILTNDGITLLPGGEIWLKIQGNVSKFIGTALIEQDTPLSPMLVVEGYWYKAGRLQNYHPPMPKINGGQQTYFQAWSAEPGGWLVIAAAPSKEQSMARIKILEVEQHE